jgi:site-specific DNA-methyltransferase (adenine-specific)
MTTLLKGDCLKIMATLPDKSVDCFICDLPYGQLSTVDVLPRKIGEKGRTKAQTGCPWDVKIDLVEFWKQVKRLCKNDHTPVLMFCNTKFGYELIKSNEKWFRHDLVWDKQRGVSFLSSNKMPMKSHEMIYVFSKLGAYYKRIDIPGKPYSSNGHSGSNTYNKPPMRGETIIHTTRCPLSVITIGRQSAGGHPTEKPMELYEWLLSRYCPDGGTVLDPTAGSFNSIFVAQKLGLKAIGIEMDTNFYWKAVKRLCGQN